MQKTTTRMASWPTRTFRGCLAVFLLPLCFAGASRIAFADAGVREWEWLGPGNAGGIVRSIIIHPDFPEQILAASPGGGIWRPKSGGERWELVGTGLPNLVVTPMALAPSNPSIVYAGTGESFATFRGAPGAGVYKSMDFGLTWARLPTTADWDQDDRRFVNSIAVHPSNPDRVLLATNAGILRTVDGGEIWTSASGLPPTTAGRPTEVCWVSATRAVAGFEPIPPPGRPSLTTDLVCALFLTNLGADWAVSTFESPSVSCATTGQSVLGSTCLTAAANAGSDRIAVESSAAFAHGDRILIGGANPESVRVTRVTRVSSGCSAAAAPIGS